MENNFLSLVFFKLVFIAIVSNDFKNIRKCLTPFIEMTEHELKRAPSFLFLGRVKSFHHLSHVLHVFFLTLFQIAPHFYPIWFAQSSPLSHRVWVSQSGAALSSSRNF